MIVRGPRRETHFTVLDNAVLRDTKLSFRARGLLAFLLSQPVGYAVDSEKLADSSGGHEGRDAVRTALREVEEAGYLRRERRQRSNGQWECVSTVYEEPTPVEPTPGNPSSVPPGETRESAGRADDGSADVGSPGDKRRSTGVEVLEEELTTPLTPLPGGDDDLVDDPIGFDTNFDSSTRTSTDSTRTNGSKPRKASNASKAKRAPTAGDVSDADFESFWSTYPRHTSKPEARRALAKALTRAGLNEILVGACRYRDDPNRLDAFTKHPTTWLNQDCWDDDPLPPRGTNGVQPANMKVSKFEGPSRRITQEELEAQGL